jgi:integrase
MAEKLTQKKVNSFRADGTQRYVSDGSVPGLSLFVGASGKKTWYLFFRAGGKRGKHKIGGAGVLTVDQARDLAKAFIGKLAAGENPHDKTPTPQNITLDDLLTDLYEKWLLAERKGGKATAAMIRSTFKQFMNRPAAALNVIMLEKWRAARLDGGTKRATVNRLAGALKSMLNWAAQRGILEANPIAKLRPVSERDSDGIVRYLKDDERARLMAALDEREALMRGGRDSHNLWLKGRKLPPRPAMNGEYADYLKPLTLVALNTGARRGALFGLKWGDVDIENKTILFAAANAKSEKPLRVPLNTAAASTLAKWKLQSRARGDDDLVFPSTKTGQRFGNINKSWAALMKRADIKNFRFHDTRHDYASRLVMNGVDLFAVKELLGHADIKMTQRYAHLAPGKLAAAVETISEPPNDRGVSR